MKSISMNKIRLSFLFFGIIFALSCTRSGGVLWQVKIGAELWAPLIKAGNVLYLGSDNGNFYAIDIDGQKIKWLFRTGGKIRSAALYQDKLVSFASDDGFLYTLNSDHGNLEWKFRLAQSKKLRREPAKDAPYEYDFLHSSPVYRDGLLYIGSSNGVIYALMHKTGKLRWKYGTSKKIRSTPVVDDKKVYVGSWDGYLYALDKQNGRVVWKYSCEGVIQSSPALGEENVFVGCRGANIYAIKRKSGKLAWKYKHKDGSWIESSPLYSKGKLYIGSSDALKLLVFNAMSGELLWMYKTGGWTWSKPVISGKNLYLGSISAYPYYFEGVTLVSGFYSLNLEKKEENWKFLPKALNGYITGGVFATPVVFDDVVYVAALDGNLYALKK